MDGVVPALGRADRPRAAGVAGPGGDGCCSGPCGRSRRSDGSAAGRRRRSRARRAAAAGLDAREASEGAREELVPGAETGEHRVDVDLEPLRPDLLGLCRGGRGERRREVETRRSPSSSAPSASSPPSASTPASTLRRSSSAPRRHWVAPGLDLEAPSPQAVDRERALVAVVAERLERPLRPAAVAGAAVAHPRAENAVAVAEDRRRDRHVVAGRALDRDRARNPPRVGRPRSGSARAPSSRSASSPRVTGLMP